MDMGKYPKLSTHTLLPPLLSLQIQQSLIGAQGRGPAFGPIQWCFVAPLSIQPKMPIKCRLMLWISLVGSTPGEFSLLSLCRFLCRCVHLLSTLCPVKMHMVLLPTWNFLHFIYKLSGVGSLVLLREFSGTLRPGAPAQSLFIITAGYY